MTAVCALIVAATLSVESERTRLAQDPAIAAQPGPITAALAATSTLEGPEAWMFDKRVDRPRALGALYGTLGVLQVVDIYSTYRAIAAGGREVNPVVQEATSTPAAMIALKAASTAASIYFAERAWKSNRKGSVILMAVVNGVTAAVVANNLRHSRGARR